MTVHQWKVAALLFCSGLCALIYQTVWLRQFRLIFGASTFATAAVLAIFMGGLGLGSALLGKRADRKAHPLQWYATLEIGIALSAAISPLLLWIAAKIYFALGGSVSMGIAGASVVRLVLATLVLAVPTVLMGGTLPAAARAVETTDDSGRRAVSLLYGINTLGAVMGALISTFYLLEMFGNRQTLFIAVLLNLLVAMAARRISASLPVNEVTDVAEEEAIEPAAPRRFVYISAAIVGFAFLLMELVWYRMLSPLLGGTTFMFGLILAVALLGIGLGGTAYALLRRGPATAGGFALTCAFEALAMAVPFALGDRLAIVTNILRPIGLTGFAGSVAAWTLITSIVVLPAAFVAGVQFPLLISLLGRGREQVGREIGAAYAWNTGGAIAGSLAGGFGLMPLLTAPGCWRLVPFLLSVLGIVAVTYAMRQRQVAFAATAVGAALLATLAITAEGPTAVWRHSGIGAGRARQAESANDLRAWMNDSRNRLLWEADGRESSIALTAGSDLSFVVNGKVDGSVRGDAPTQVMSGLIGAILHPRELKRSLVVGLGTGSTSGWLAAIPSMQRVDVVELEPAVLQVARASQPINANAMRNPRMHTIIGDAREVLLASPARYDMIFSEPSNPYRAGISSLFTQEFYEASSERLTEDGLFLQWVQLYSIDAATMRTIYATLSSVFPHVVTFRTVSADAVLVASRKPIVFDVDRIRQRVAQEPFRSALLHTWRTTTAEGFVSHVVGNETLSRMAAEDAADLNTDDRQVIEFGFARTLGDTQFIHPLERTSEALGLLRPQHVRGAIDWRAVERERKYDTEALAREAWDRADTKHPGAEELITELRAFHPIEADAVLARLRFRQGKHAEAAELVHRALVAFRTNPWPLPGLMSDTIGGTGLIVAADPSVAPKLYDALSQPFMLGQQEWNRRAAKAYLAHDAFGCGEPTIQALRVFEPTPPWEEKFLGLRVRCYATRPELQELTLRAWNDLEEYVAATPKAVVRRRDRPVSPGSSSGPR
ncbi:MAG TPA: fused MFS/spermidine synthase [Thermoanaerobaculia bacterium]|jgi:spermidine synthase/MFS family permease